EDHIPFVLAVLIVGDDDGTTGPQRLESFFYGGKAHREPPSETALNARRRSTWRARMSVSRLTWSPAARLPRVVAASVSGMSETSSRGSGVGASLTAGTGGGVPSVEIDPLSTTRGARSAGRPTRSTDPWSPGRTSMISPVPSTWPGTMC